MAPVCTMPRLDDASFEAAIASAPTPVLVYSIGGSCPDCGRVEHPIPDALRWGADQVRCYCIDGSANPVTAGRYGITQLPTLLLFRAGKVVRRFVGCPIFGDLDLILRMELGTPRR